jgi:hypothetical protein
MNRIARWRIWLGNWIMGNPRVLRAVLVPAGTPRWKRYLYRFRRPPTPAMPTRPFVRQPWMSPPEDELGVALPVQKVLTTGDEAVVVLSSCVAYTSGFQLGISIRKKYEAPPLSNPRLHREMPEMSLEVGVRFADGRETSPARDAEQRKAFSEAFAAGSDPPLPPGPMIGSGGGGGGGRRWDWTYWIWPLPPDGPLTVVARWPAGRVPDGEVQVEGSAIRRAGERSEKLW